MSKFTYTIRADGRLMKVVTYKNKQYPLYSHDPKDLERQYHKLKNDLNIGKQIIKKDAISIEEYSDYWYEHYIENSKLKQKTKKDYKDCIRLYIKPNIGKFTVQNIEEVDINDFLQKLAEKNLTRRREMSLMLLKRIFNKACKNKLREDNPAADVQLEKYVSEEKKPLPIEIISLILSMPNDLDESVFMMKLILTTGLRLEEVSPLQKKDVLKAESMLSINKVVDLDSKELTITNYTKNRDNRKVPILNFIYDDLINKIESSNNKLIFPNTKGKIKSRYSFRRDLERFLKILNEFYEKKQKEQNKDFALDEDNKIKFTYHQLRHSYVTLLNKIGIDLKTAQSFTGHKDLIVLLKVYTHIDDDDISNAKDKMNTYFKENLLSNPLSNKA